MDLGKAKACFLQIMDSLDPSNRDAFADFVKEYLHGREEERFADVKVVFEEIKEALRSKLPVHATLESEKIMFPSISADSNMSSMNTLHIDAFLYDEEEEDQLVENGQLTRAFCRDCGSHNTQEFNFITHSCSQSQLDVLFRKMLPDLSGKTLVDVGSRLGAVLYGAYLLSDAEEIVGIEMNKDFCDLQKYIVESFQFQSRVKILEGDMFDMGEIISKADVVVLNNVFEWFLPSEGQIKAWQFLHNFVTPGTLLVTSPPLEKTIEVLNTGINIASWVMPMENEHWSEQGNGLSLSLYEVL